MNSNRRGFHGDRSNSSASDHLHQRTIPEMLANRHETMMGSRSIKNVGRSEQAVAPTSYYPATPVTYEHQSGPRYGHQYQMYRPDDMMYHHEPPSSASSSHGQEAMYQQLNPASMYLQEQPAGGMNRAAPRASSYYDPAPPPSKAVAMSPQIMYQQQPYYGVPGFYTPNYGSSYTEAVATPTCHDDREPYVQRSHTAVSSCSLGAAHVPPLPSLPPAPASTSLLAPTARKRAIETSKVEVEMSPVPSKQARGFTMESNSGTGTPTKQAPRARAPPPSLHVLSGPVQRVLKWQAARDLQPILFEVVARVKSMRQTVTHHELLLRDEAGPVLQVVFYEIDRLMPTLQPGQLVRVVGRMTSRARLQAFSVRPASEIERASMQRISFVCNRAASQLLPAT